MERRDFYLILLLTISGVPMGGSGASAPPREFVWKRWRSLASPRKNDTKRLKLALITVKYLKC